MLTVAYLANEFPNPVEPYVGEEIDELRRRGVQVVAGSVRKARDKSLAAVGNCAPQIVVQGASGAVFARAMWLCIRKWKHLAPLLCRIAIRGAERPMQRLKAVVHTVLGACYAVLLEGRGVAHIHVHHGYFGSWIAMTAAQLLEVGFSLTLHGSDLLLHRTFLDVKLANCTFCLTVSEYNRRYILDRFPQVAPGKVSVARLGVDIPEDKAQPSPMGRRNSRPFTLLAVGRLHRVKDHAFLVKACAQLARKDVDFLCLIAGEGPERRNLESLVCRNGLGNQVTLLGHVPRERMNSLYDQTDLVVLTSRSEGIPLVLMEAMARQRVVLAPAITGIPELVVTGKTGFLYEPGSQESFLDLLLFIHTLIRVERECDRQNQSFLPSAAQHLDRVRHAARVQALENFNRKTNVELFANLFLQRITARRESIPDANTVLQQI